VRRGDIYRVAESTAADATRYRLFVVVSRQALLDSRHSTAVCAPIYATRIGLTTEVHVGPAEGLRQDGSIHCDVLMSLPKAKLTQRVGGLSDGRLDALDRALATALALAPETAFPAHS